MLGTLFKTQFILLPYINKDPVYEKQIKIWMSINNKLGDNNWNNCYIIL